MDETTSNKKTNRRSSLQFLQSIFGGVSRSKDKRRFSGHVIEEDREVPIISYRTADSNSSSNSNNSSSSKQKGGGDGLDNSKEVAPPTPDQVGFLFVLEKNGGWQRYWYELFGYD